MTQRIAFSICALIAVIAGCQSPAPSTSLGPPPDPVLSTRPPRLVAPIPLPEPLAPAPAPRAGPQTLRGVTLVVDPGHGGHDPGASGRSAIPEKTINLNIAVQLGRRLRERGAEVIMTRSSDRFISLDGRAAQADRAHADLFVSLHADSARRASAAGLTIYVSREASAASRAAAQRIAAALQSVGLDVRGVQTAGFRVLVAHSRPAVLIECGFLTNRAEAERLATSAYQATIAEAIADGIAEHFSR